MAIGKFYCTECGNKNGAHKAHCPKLPKSIRKLTLCYGSKVSGCDSSARFLVEKKGSLSHRRAYYCKECVQPYRDSEEGIENFTVKSI